MARRQFQFCAFALFLSFVHFSLLPSHAHSQDSQSKSDSSVATAPSGSTEIVEGDTVVVTVDDARLVLGDEPMAKLTKDTTFTVLKVHENWVGVTHRVDGKEIGGWVHRRHLTTTEHPRNTPLAENQDRTPADPVTNAASEKQYAEAIREVYDKIIVSWATFRKESRQAEEEWWRLGDPRVYRRLFDRITSIDTNECPQQFQQAFDDYLDAMHEWTETKASMQGWGALVPNVVTRFEATYIPGCRNLDDYVKKVRGATFRMKRIAMQYGIKF